MADVNEMRRLVGEFSELARTTRLASEKLVKARKEQIREEEVARGRAEFARHFKALCERLGGPYLPPMQPDFAAAIKGLKSLESVRNAIDTEIAAAKIHASAEADRIEANLKTIRLVDKPTLFPDVAALAIKAHDDLVAVIAQRVDAEQRRQDAERERIRAEEAARLDREIAAAEPKVTGEQGHTLQDSSRELSHALASKPDAMQHAREAAAAIEGPPPLTLGTICDRLGLTVTADLLARLGYPHTQQRQAKLYREADFAPICLALAAHCVRAAG
jgi:hypothetical protein